MKWGLHGYVPPISYESVGFIHQPNQQLLINSKEDIIKFIDEEKEDSNKIKHSEIDRHLEEFLKSINDLLNTGSLKAVVKKKTSINTINDIGLEEGDIVEIEKRAGYYLFENQNLISILDDSQFGLFVYGFEGKTPKVISYKDAEPLIDKSKNIPILRTCKIVVDQTTQKKWLIVNKERRFISNDLYSILIRDNADKVSSMAHGDVINIHEGDKLNDTKGRFV